jgi:hypothetical protein
MAEAVATGTGEQSPDSSELSVLRRVNAELVARHTRDKARLIDLEASAATLTTKATEAETRIRQLTIDTPVNFLCESISIAPVALRTALEAEYKIEPDTNGVLTLLSRADSKPITDNNGKPLALEPDAIKNLLLATKDEEKLKLYRAILIASKANGASDISSKRTVTPRATKPGLQFGLR